MKMYMAIDQYGQTYHGLKHPRKDLCERLCNSHVEKMYQDKKDGTTVFCGYVIGGLWLQLYEVQPVEKGGVICIYFCLSCYCRFRLLLN